MIAVCLREFEAGGNVVRPGSVVDASGWPNAELLIKAKFLRPASVDEMPASEQPQRRRAPRNEVSNG